MVPALLQAPLPAHQAPSTGEGQFLRLWSSEAQERALYPVEGQAWGSLFPGIFSKENYLNCLPFLEEAAYGIFSPRAPRSFQLILHQKKRKLLLIRQGI